MSQSAKFTQSAKAGAGEMIAVYKYLQRQRPRRGSGVIHSPGAVKTGSRAAGWGSRKGLRAGQELRELDGGSGPAHCAPRTEPRFSPGHKAGAAEGLKCLKPKVPTAARCSPAPDTSARRLPGERSHARRAVPGVETCATANGAEKIQAEELRLRRHPSGWRTALPGTRFVGEREQIYFLQKIQLLRSVSPPKPQVLPQVPVPHRRCRHILQGGGAGSPGLRTSTMLIQTPSPVGGNQLPMPPAGDRARDAGARSRRGRKTLRVSPLAPEHPAAPDLSTSASSPRRGQGRSV